MKLSFCHHHLSLLDLFHDLYLNCYLQSSNWWRLDFLGLLPSFPFFCTVLDLRLESLYPYQF
jgi:hypothetical protein